MHVAMALSQSPTIHISFFSYELIAHDGARADRNEAHGVPQMYSFRPDFFQNFSDLKNFRVSFFRLKMGHFLDQFLGHFSG